MANLIVVPDEVARPSERPEVEDRIVLPGPDAAESPRERAVNGWAAEHISDFLAGARAIARLMHDLTGLSRFTLDLALRELSSLRGSLMLVDRQQLLRIEAARGLPEQIVKSTAIRVGDGVAGQVVSSGRPLLIECRQAAPPHLVGVGRYHCDTFVSVPLTGEERILGVVNITEPCDPRSFERRDLEQLVGIAESLGLAVHHALRYREVEELAVRDDLTGLYNRRYLWEFLDRILDRARQEQFPVSLLLFDLDHFKRYNDRYGHPAGDLILREVAELMRWNFRTHDVVCRMGGEEFAVVLWDGRGRQPAGGWSDYPDQAFQFAERLRCATMRHTFGAIGGETLTLSGGMATFPWDAPSRSELVERADEALYQAKRNGRNRVHLCGRSLAS